MTGRLLLELRDHDFATDLAFTPDGKKLAVSRTKVFQDSNLSVYTLEVGRGLNQLRGLVGRPEKVRFSPDGKLLAALSHDWQVAVWDLKSGFLRHILQAPRGLVADNAGLAFSPNGDRLAASAGQEAVLWDVENGTDLKRWSLPIGFQDNLAFDATGNQLFSVRVETSDPKVPPYETDWTKYPRIMSIRDLLGAKPTDTLARIEDFRCRVYDSIISPDGSYVLAEGLAGPTASERIFKVFKTATGEEVLPLNVKGNEKDGAYFWLDPEGKLLSFFARDGEDATLVEIPSGKHLGTSIAFAGQMSPSAKYWAGGTEPGLPLRRKGEKEPVIRLGIDVRADGQNPFNRAGTHLAWGCIDGAVTVCDIEEVLRRLTEIGLGWE